MAAGDGDDVVRVVWGTATGPTAVAAYDAALAEAGAENYNLVTVSSILPAEATVEPVGTAPDLGPAGNRLTVVQARATVDASEGTADRATAGLAWTHGPGPGLFYEVAGGFDEGECRDRLVAGLDAGRSLRDWPVEGTGERIVGVDAPSEGFATALVLGVYGESDPIL